MARLHGRADAFVQSWPVALRRDFQNARKGRARGRRLEALGAPFWITLPSDLAARYGLLGNRSGGAFLKDVLWGQFCLFAFIRLQDDLYDDQATGKALLFGADQFLIEGERAFARQMARSAPFWRYFWTCLEETTRAIVRVDALQRTPRGRPRSLLAGYAEVAAVFKVALAAVCLRGRDPRQLKALGEIVDELAIAGQILDDAEDVREDLDRGRFNYVAKTALRNHKPAFANAGQAWPRVADQLSRGDTLERVMGEARQCIERTQCVARSSEIGSAEAYATSALTSFNTFRAKLHGHRVDLMLGGGIRRRRQDPA